MLDSEKRWYVIQTYSGMENKVVNALKERVALARLEEKFDDFLVPTEEVVEMKGGQKRKSERKFYPSYVFVKMLMDDTTWHLVAKMTNVIGFVGGDKPTPISDAEANRIIQSMESGVVKPKIVYEPGEVVRVTEGPFKDFSAIVEEVNYAKNHLRVAVLIFGRSTPVELEFGQVEKT